MNAATLPYPAIFRTYRRERSMLNGSSASGKGSASLLRARSASRESPIRLLLLCRSDQDDPAAFFPDALAPGRECAGSRAYSAASNVRFKQHRGLLKPPHGWYERKDTDSVRFVNRAVSVLFTIDWK